MVDSAFLPFGSRLSRSSFLAELFPLVRIKLRHCSNSRVQVEMVFMKS